MSTERSWTIAICPGCERTDISVEVYHRLKEGKTVPCVVCWNGPMVLAKATEIKIPIKEG